MTFYQLRKAAEGVDIPVKDAMLQRVRYLKGELAWCLCYKGDSVELCRLYAAQLREEIVGLQESYKRSLRPQREDAITDDDIAAAKAYPITQLVEFTRGVAHAFCHDDKRPSLTHMNRSNKAWCPSCGKYYDTIDILMLRDGLTWPAAVKQLRG